MPPMVEIGWKKEVINLIDFVVILHPRDTQICTKRTCPTTKTETLKHQSKLQICINKSAEWKMQKCRHRISRGEICLTEDEMYYTQTAA
jgi:hypothetical protein